MQGPWGKRHLNPPLPNTQYSVIVPQVWERPLSLGLVKLTPLPALFASLLCSSHENREKTIEWKTIENIMNHSNYHVKSFISFVHVTLVLLHWNHSADGPIMLFVLHYLTLWDVFLQR